MSTGPLPSLVAAAAAVSPVRDWSSREARCAPSGHRHGSRTRSLTGTFGPIEIAVPRARLNTADGKTTEWKSKALRAYQRRTLAAAALPQDNLARWCI